MSDTDIVSGLIAIASLLAIFWIMWRITWVVAEHRYESKLDELRTQNFDLAEENLYLSDVLKSYRTKQREALAEIDRDLIDGEGR